MGGDFIWMVILLVVLKFKTFGTWSSQVKKIIAILSAKRKNWIMNFTWDSKMFFFF